MSKRPKVYTKAPLSLGKPNDPRRLAKKGVKVPATDIRGRELSGAEVVWEKVKKVSKRPKAEIVDGVIASAFALGGLVSGPPSVIQQLSDLASWNSNIATQRTSLEIKTSVRNRNWEVKRSRRKW